MIDEGRTHTHTPEGAGDNLKGRLHERCQPQRIREFILRGVALKEWGAHGDTLFVAGKQKKNETSTLGCFVSTKKTESKYFSRTANPPQASAGRGEKGAARRERGEKEDAMSKTRW